MAPVEYDIDGDLATITMDNPPLRNALTLEAAELIQEAIDDIEDSDARCVILEGTDETFCAGGDIESMLEGLASDRDTKELMEEVGLPINRTVQRVYECSLPTVAKVDGAAFGAGASLAIACDIVLASERAEMSFGFRRIGLSIDSGTSYLLPRVVGEKTAMELVYTGDLLDAEEAKSENLLNRVFPTEEFDEQCEEVVQEIVTGPTVALKHSKDLLQEGGDRTFDEAIEAEVEALGTVFETEDFSEGVNAFVERRTPEFEGR
jgi:2-(1,2-epoxy-1,2-dihydrophenyl)acetyl-CoA isomerase